MDNRKTKLIIIACLSVAILGLSIGYALLSTRLNITGTAKVPASKWDVIFKEKEIVITPTGTAGCSIGTIEGTSISGMSVEFNKPGDACNFSIPVENTGNISAKLVDVTGKSSNLTFVGSGKTALSDQELLQKNVVYEVNYGKTPIKGDTEFSNIELLKAGATETVTLRVTFNHEAEDIPKNPVKLGGLDRGFIFESLTKEEGDSQTGSSLDNIPNPPELNGDMIPVYYEKSSDKEGTWKKADINNENNNWYDYSEQKWANAVTIISDKREEIKKANVGTPINMDDINTMWVWIPRYSYTIKSENGGANYFGKASSENKNPSQALPGEIDVKFISKVTETGSAKYTGSTPINWRTNEAFDFGGEKRSGIWVGKFETTGTLASQDVCVDETCDVSKITIKPGITSLRRQRVSSLFYATRSMLKDISTFGFSTNGDLHIMKNDEWGAVAYLSQSKYGKYGNKNYSGKYKEIYQNKSTGYITGSSNGTPGQNDTIPTQYAYNDMTDLGDEKGQAGPGASTTGSIYGIYDMSGGIWEYVMGVLAYYEAPYLPMSGNSTTMNSGFTGKVYENDTYVNFTNNISLAFPDTKYYNLYKVSTTNEGMPKTSDLKNSVKACNGGICYGQALSETSGWYGDYAGFVYREDPWSARGGHYSVNSTAAGIFSSGFVGGNAIDHGGFRFVLTP